MTAAKIKWHIDEYLYRIVDGGVAANTLHLLELLQLRRGYDILVMYILQ
jgi:hypothetical protein